MLRRMLLSRLTLVVFSVLLPLVMVEISLRAWRWLHPSPIPDQSNARVVSRPAYRTPGFHYAYQDNFATMEYHPALGFRPSPDQEGNGYRINKHGFRSRGEIDAIESGEIRVFLLGGSFAFGAGCADGYTYADVLEKNIKAPPGKRVRIINAGVGAYTSYQEFVLLLTQIRQLQPSLVVHLSGWNDAYNGYCGRSVLDGNDYMNLRGAFEACIDRKILEKHRQFFIDQETPPDWSDYRLKLHYYMAKMSHARRAQQEVAVKKKKASRPPEEVIGNLKLLLELEKTVADRDHFEVLYVLQPDLYSTKKELHEHEQKIKSAGTVGLLGIIDYYPPLFGAYRAKLPDICSSLNIEFMDSEAALEKVESNTCCFVDHVHFGEIGQEWLGRYLADQINPRLVGIEERNTKSSTRAKKSTSTAQR